MTGHDERSREGGRALVRSAITAVLVVVLYAVLPVRAGASTSSVLVLAFGLVLLSTLVVARVRQINVDTSPRLRAAEALALVVPLFVAMFAWTYLLLSQAELTSFTEPLNKIGALYFTLTILSTVGFGDISAQTDLARLLVCAQIVLTFTLLAATVRAILTAGRARSASRAEGT